MIWATLINGRPYVAITHVFCSVPDDMASNSSQLNDYLVNVRRFNTAGQCLTRTGTFPALQGYDSYIIQPANQNAKARIYTFHP